jgi:hypothetical protein
LRNWPDPGRRLTTGAKLNQILGGIVKEAVAAEDARIAHSKTVVTESSGAKMLCPKCGGSKKMVQHNYNSSYNPYDMGTLGHGLFEANRDSTSFENCDRCRGTGVVDAR